ncbi:MAG: aminoacyl-tRNA hydrolase [Lachnospiraceae bacterium]|nr:aminoacyl-tRNA hydrolase [Parasporobacterium sp.]MBR4168647.1 aminoacyl-tRNA hydrolase [Lachnospiraceae bacterium]MCR5268808.1 aminoacyl-tRNA hydrolase [Lachnospiraceae bacterium]
MYIIAGLGNPKTEYKNTRHNVGFDVIDVLSDKYQIPMDMKKHRAICGKGMIEGEKVILAEPQTFMNLSGLSILELVNYYKIDPASELIVVYDDIDLEPGQIRIRKQGSAGGHNGMKSVIGGLNTQDFIRIRMGVGDKPKQYDLADYVLGHFTKEEREVVDEAVIRATEAIHIILTDGVDQAMNRFNRKKEQAAEEESEDA